MSGYDNELTGILSRNERKTEPGHSDFKGNAVINGAEYWIDAWVNERKDGSGRKFFKLKFKPKSEQQASGKTRTPARDDLSDDIPF
jgi:hypothetical protein